MGKTSENILLYIGVNQRRTTGDAAADNVVMKFLKKLKLQTKGIADAKFAIWDCLFFMYHTPVIRSFLCC